MYAEKSHSCQKSTRKGILHGQKHINTRLQTTKNYLSSPTSLSLTYLGQMAIAGIGKSLVKKLTSAMSERK
jgi:hypothetical protein